MSLLPLIQEKCANWVSHSRNYIRGPFFSVIVCIPKGPCITVSSPLLSSFSMTIPSQELWVSVIFYSFREHPGLWCPSPLCRETLSSGGVSAAMKRLQTIDIVRGKEEKSITIDMTWIRKFEGHRTHTVCNLNILFYTLGHSKNRERIIETQIMTEAKFVSTKVPEC